ncbi:MAG: signal peptidase I [Parcubacteria group bacterium]
MNTILFGLVVLGALVVFSSVPFAGNYKAFIVMSGSMEPTIHTGSIVFVRPEKAYAVGDIVTRRFADSDLTVTHRIFSQKEVDGQVIFDTKGDANDGEDNATVTSADIIGKEITAVPYVGYAVAYAKTEMGLLLIIVIPAVIVIYDELNKIRTEVALMRKKKKEEKEAKTRVAEETKITFPERQYVRGIVNAPVEKRRKIV